MRQDMTSPLPPEVAEALDAVDRAVQDEALHWSMAETLREAFIAMSAKLEAAEGEVARLREDARRYQFLRRPEAWRGHATDGAELDAAIDAALQEHTP